MKQKSPLRCVLPISHAVRDVQDPTPTVRQRQKLPAAVATGCSPSPMLFLVAGLRTSIRRLSPFPASQHLGTVCRLNRSTTVRAALKPLVAKLSSCRACITRITGFQQKSLAVPAKYFLPVAPPLSRCVTHQQNNLPVAAKVKARSSKKCHDHRRCQASKRVVGCSKKASSFQQKIK